MLIALFSFLDTILSYFNISTAIFSYLTTALFISFFDYINSIVHEVEHVKQAMLNAYDVEDKGEPPAYTIGYIAMKMLEIFKVLYK